MRRIQRHLSFANVASGIALFVALSGGTAVALSGTNTVFTDDIANDTQPAAGGNPAGGLVAADLRPGSVGTSEIANFSIGNLDIANNAVESTVVQNGTLDDQDVGKGTFVNFLGNIGVVPAHRCVDRPLAGINATGDHLLLAANWDGSHPQLSYSVEYRTSSADAVIKVCNPTTGSIDDSFTRFNLLVFDA